MRLVLAALILSWGVKASSSEVLIPKGVYSPIFKDAGDTEQAVGPFWMDKTPVTNEAFLEFLKKHPRYTKSRIPSLFASEHYLSRWPGNLQFPKGEGQFPVTHVSWFVARKFCESQGKRLPTIAEWEYASDSQNPAVEARILKWYSTPRTQLRNVGQVKNANKHGLLDMHDLTWEWVENFAEVMITSDSRDKSAQEAKFCAGGSLNAKDPKAYAAFIRFAFRSSLTAAYSSKNLSFRCVKDVPGGNQ